MEEVEQPKRKISKWVVGAGILGAVAVTVGVTAYYVKKKRNEELKVQRYSNEEEGFMGKLGKYWRTTVDTFNVLKSYFPSYGKKNAPLMDAKSVKEKEIVMSDASDGDW